MPDPVKLVTTPTVVILPTEWVPGSVNHMFPSGPATIPVGSPIPGSVKYESTPLDVIVPIELPLANHTLPSGPNASAVTWPGPCATTVAVPTGVAPASGETARSTN